MSAQVLLGRQCCLPAPQGRLQTPAAAARRPAGRRRACAVRAGSDFAQLRSAAADAVAAAQSKLPALEQAARTAARAREPAAEAERHWQELHSKLTTLQRDAAEATKRLRADVAAAAGGEAQATHALLQVHVKDRLDAFRASHGLAAATEWKVRLGYHVLLRGMHEPPGGTLATAAPTWPAHPPAARPRACCPAGVPAAGPAAALDPGRAHAVPGGGR